MENLTFGEQVKIVLSRKGMTIKELAEIIEERTGKKMSRQNLTQRLGRDNFQEQDMRQIAEILECPFQLNILGASDSFEKVEKKKKKEKEKKPEVIAAAIPVEVQEETEAAREITIGDLVDLAEEKSEEKLQRAVETRPEYNADEKSKASMTNVFKGFRKPVSKPEAEEPVKKPEQQEQPGEINPYTLREYETNSVRTHPKRIGYVQVYDRAEHKWTDMTEWAFLGYQERKKKLLGRDYVPPVYLD